jgi:hypothetical protein
VKRLIPHLLAAAVVGLALPANADNTNLRGRYFLVVWGYQGAGNAPRESHVFATFYEGDDLAEGRTMPATISWLPATGVNYLLGVEPGRNFSLTQTVALACQTGKQVASWGPYEITLALYRRALARIELLRSGRVAYSLLSLRAGTMNCIDAAGDITDTSFHPGISWGFKASKAVIRHLSPFFKIMRVRSTSQFAFLPSGMKAGR